MFLCIMRETKLAAHRAHVKHLNIYYRRCIHYQNDGLSNIDIAFFKHLNIAASTDRKLVNCNVKISKVSFANHESSFFKIHNCLISAQHYTSSRVDEASRPLGGVRCVLRCLCDQKQQRHRSLDYSRRVVPTQP